ncbi:uncharacterized protein [Arachis hypogaea]|uniref:uncharacterized protein n=2 Tax=Arachis TaxID=3817 RepID=UPI003B2166F2
MGYLFEFIAYYVALQRAKISKDVLCQIFEYLTSERYSATNVLVHGLTPKNKETQVLALSEILPDSDWDAYVLELCESTQYHQILYKMPTPHGSPIPLHENDIAENSYGHQQISRFEILNSLQKNERFIQIENLPQLRLAPPAVYHEKVNKVIDFHAGKSSSSSSAVLEKQSRNNKQNRELRVKGSLIRFPLKSTIFGQLSSDGKLRKDQIEARVKILGYNLSQLKV